jgi:hypothetical protein
MRCFFGPNRQFLCSVVLGLLVAGSAVAFGQPPLAPPPQPVIQAAATAEVNTPGIDILTRGPLHEAFAAPVNLGGVAPPVVSQQLPDAIQEAPSEYRPENDSAVWIPGYWAWDDARNGYVWVSGIWRIPPPGREWISGYWTQSNGGCQWAPGFWTSAETEEVMYYPQPPAAEEQGSSTPAPSPDAFWAPGSWVWQNDHFVWTTGFWTTARQGWVWTPTSYSWTPRGYVRVDGYWDYDLSHRGIAFAPAAIAPAVYQRSGFVYTPTVAIDLPILSFYLFARPAYDQYYFGDYFGAEFERLGYYPWYDVHRGTAYVYDPLFTYDRWYYERRDPQWVENLQGWHRYYREHPAARPPHDFVQQRRLEGEHTERADRRYLAIGQPIANLAGSTTSTMRLTRLAPAERNRAMEIARSNHEFQTQRAKMESVAAGARGQGPANAAAMVRSPQRAAFPRRTNAIVGARTQPNERVGQGTANRVAPEQPGRLPPSMTGAKQPTVAPGQYPPGQREVFKPILPGGQNPPEATPGRGSNPQPRPEPPANPNRGNVEPPRTGPLPSQQPPRSENRGNADRGNQEPPKSQPGERPQGQPQPAPRHAQAPNVETPHRNQPQPQPAERRPEPSREPPSRGQPPQASPPDRGSHTPPGHDNENGKKPHG